MNKDADDTPVFSIQQQVGYCVPFFCYFIIYIVRFLYTQNPSYTFIFNFYKLLSYRKTLIYCSKLENMILETIFQRITLIVERVQIPMRAVIQTNVYVQGIPCTHLAGTDD